MGKRVQAVREEKRNDTMVAEARGDEDEMPQMILPIFPAEATPINERLAFFKKDGMVYYLQGSMPVFSHAENDKASFRLFTSQLYINGNCKQREIVEAFGVTPISVKRSVKKLTEEGPEAFFKKRRKGNKAVRPGVMTAQVVRDAVALLEEGMSAWEAAKALGIRADTLRKAISSGRVKIPQKKLK